MVRGSIQVFETEVTSHKLQPIRRAGRALWWPSFSYCISWCCSYIKFRKMLESTSTAVLFSGWCLNFVGVLEHDVTHRLHHFTVHLYREFFISGREMSHHRTAAHHPFAHHTSTLHSAAHPGTATIVHGPVAMGWPPRSIHLRPEAQGPATQRLNAWYSS